MFKRRQPLNGFQKLREALWPSMGWSRYFRYLLQRIIRLSDTPYSIAGGLANGAAISFTPIVGTHIVQAIIISFFTRCNYFASVIGTIIGNPWTFPIMWYLSYKLGVVIFSLFGMSVAVKIPEGISFLKSIELALHQPFELFVPWLLGGYILALVTWPAFFTLFYVIIRKVKNIQHQRRLKRIHQVAQEVTGQQE